MIANITTPARQTPAINVGSIERMGSLIMGGALALYGLGRAYPGLTLGFIGGALLYRGITGHCAIYQSLDLSTAPALPPQQPDPAAKLPETLPRSDDPIDAAMEESFPASDPPFFNS